MVQFYHGQDCEKKTIARIKGIFPGNDYVSQFWRQSTYASIYAIETEYTVSGYPSLLAEQQATEYDRLIKKDKFDLRYGKFMPPDNTRGSVPNPHRVHSGPELVKDPDFNLGAVDAL